VNEEHKMTRNPTQATAANADEATPAAPPPTVLDRVSDASIAIASVALLGLVVVQGWQVFARYVINDSPSWTEPVTIVLLAAAMSFGAASGVHTGRHFGFFLLAQAMGPLQRRIVDTVVNLVVAAIGAVLAGWGAVLLLDGLDIKMAGAPLPQSLPYLPLAVGGALMVVFALARGVAVWNGREGGEG
jgi:TRAP-type C4-dicarboxylate transport system permease small subunit